MPRILRALAWIVLGALCTGCERLPRPEPVGVNEITFGNGVQMTFQYPFRYDRNALETCVPVPGGWVALTHFGSLLTFDRTFQVTRDLADRRYQCLCAAGDLLLAATADGTIDRLDRRTLEGRELARVPGRPWAILCDPGGGSIIAILRQPGQGQGDGDSAIAWDVFARRGYEIADDPTAFYLDRSHRLWIGADNGEWGGWCRVLDLKTGRLGETNRTADGVYGFAELSDGTVLAYGGMSHFGLEFAHIWKADGTGKLDDAYVSERKETRRGAPSSPEVPITQIVPLKDRRTLAVFAYDDVFLVDRDFQRWQHLATLDLRYIPGRPDAMGSYPAVNSVHEIGSAPPSLLCSSVLDGLVEIRGNQVISHTLASDLDPHDFRLFGPYQDGVIGGNSNAWAASDLVFLRDGAAAPFNPAFPDPPPGEKWRRIYPVRIDAGQQVLFADEGHSPGEGVLVRWRGGKREILSSGDVPLWGESIFQTPDGKFWEAGGETLKELADGKWREDSKLPKGTGLEFKVVNDSAPWRLVGNGKLWLLHDGPGAAYMEEVDETGPDGQPLICRDGLAQGDQYAASTILATDKGIYLWKRAGVPDLELGGDRKASDSLTTGKEIFHAYDAARDPHCLCRDEQGALWIGGAGLWCVPEGSREACGLTLFPPQSGVAITSLVPSPTGGIVAAASDGSLLRASATGPAQQKPSGP